MLEEQKRIFAEFVLRLNDLLATFALAQLGTKVLLSQIQTH